jgi:catechol 2,3-dioxygenase-like lactoylglutathione lyase family enzyme
MGKVISGIQQVGIGVANAEEAFQWYKKYFGMDILVFQDEAEAKLMTRYTGGVVQKRNAYLALNMQSGGGFEIWQYTSRIPKPAQKPIKLGDLGIFCIKMKSKNIQKSYEYFKAENIDLVSEVTLDPAGKPHFYLKDPYGNFFEMIESDYWFTTNKDLTGGVAGSVLGVSDIDKSIEFYKNILGYDKIVYDKTQIFNDFESVQTSSKNKFRRVLLKHSTPYKGGFTNLFGPSELELVQLLDGDANKIFQDRYWGDLGYIHLCYDINGMEFHEQDCEKRGFPLTVNSKNSFDMGEAAGQFVYNEDPDGTLIEYVETHKVPLIKKIGWYLNMKKRNPEKALPNYIVKAMRFSRVK